MPKEHLLTAARESGIPTSLSGSSSPGAAMPEERLETQVTRHMWAHPPLLAALAARDPRCDSSTRVTNMCCPPSAAPGEIQCPSLSCPPASPHFQSSPKAIYFTEESSLSFSFPFVFPKEETDSAHTASNNDEILLLQKSHNMFCWKVPAPKHFSH